MTVPLEPFENIVTENQQWLLRYVRKIVRSESAAEDIVQEAFIRAYRAYDGYQERGRIRQWLAAIARNAAFRYLQSEPTNQQVSLDSGDSGLIELVGTSPSVEEQVVNHELALRIIQAIGNLSEAQRSVLYYRFVEDYGIQEVARLTSQPVGSVKSKSHYGLRQVRRSLHQYLMEGEHTMDCKEAYAYLFQYAKGQIMKDDKERVEDHLAVCPSCSNLADSLRILAHHISPAEDREMRHYMIAIPLDNGQSLSYFGLTFPMDDYERLNALLRERNGIIPPDENWFGSGHDADLEHVAEFDNEGHRIEFELVPNSTYSNNVRVKYRRMVKVYPMHHMSSVGLRKQKHVSPTIEDPNLMVGKLNNHLGSNGKSGLYLAVPSSARNIRIRRGNGVIDAGAYNFAFSERYVVEDEAIRLECTYLIQ